MMNKRWNKVFRLKTDTKKEPTLTDWRSPESFPTTGVPVEIMTNRKEIFKARYLRNIIQTYYYDYTFDLIPNTVESLYYTKWRYYDWFPFETMPENTPVKIAWTFDATPIEVIKKNNILYYDKYRKIDYMNDSELTKLSLEDYMNDSEQWYWRKIRAQE